MLTERKQVTDTKKTHYDISTDVSSSGKKKKGGGGGGGTEYN